MSDRHEQARAEAERRYPHHGEDIGDAYGYGHFMDGWLAADDNPQPTTITRGDFQAICFEIAGQVDPNMRRSEVLAIGVLGGLVALGVEVTDDE